MTGRVTVESRARLHFGILDLRGDLGRRFGGLGTSAPGIAVRVSAVRADAIEATGPDAARAADFARRFVANAGLPGGVALRVEHAIPSHHGLGSGTQLALAVGRAIAELHGLDIPPPALARAVGRAHRSAVGTWTFAGGGLVVEGGIGHGDAEDVGPLLARAPFPGDWRCVMVLPDAPPGLSGFTEASAFAALPPPPRGDAERIAHLVLMAMLPALPVGDLVSFGRALGEVQDINGRWFAPVQGGVFAPASARVVSLMRRWGVAGAGQSSWGPAAYAVVGSEDDARALSRHLAERLGDAAAIHLGPFATTGASVERMEHASIG